MVVYERWDKMLNKLLSALDVHMQEVVSSASISLIFRVLGAAAQFGFTVIIARLFGAEGMGAYALALSLVVIASSIGRWGLDQASLKYIAAYADRDEWQDINKIFYKAIVLVSSFSIFVSVFLYLLTPWLATALYHEDRLADLLRLLALSILPFSLLNLLAECFRAVKKIALYTLIQGLLVPALSAIFLLLFYNLNIGLEAVAYAYVLATSAIFGIAFYLWLQHSHAQHNAKAREEVSTADLLSCATPMAWVAIISIAISFSETLLLGVFRSVEEVGIYAVALRLALLINFIIVAFNSILAPKFAVLYREKSLLDIQRLSKHSVMAMMIMTLPLFIVFFIFPEIVLKIFSSEFSQASNVLRILAVGQLINVCAGPVGILLLMTGHEKHMHTNVLVSLCGVILFGMVLIPVFGVIGAACSAVFGMTLLNFLSVWSVKKYLSIEMPGAHFLSFKKRGPV